MVGMSDAFARQTLDNLTGKSPSANRYMAVFTTVGTDGGSGFVEPSGGGYARAMTTAAMWNSASGSAPVQSTNANAITFPTATGNWGSILAWGLYDAAVGGTLLIWDYCGPAPWLPFYCTAASPGVLDVASHGYQTGDSVVISNEFGGSLPTTPGTWAGVLTVANPTFDSLNVGVNTTSSGDGSIRKITVQSVGSGVTLVYNPNSLVLQLS